MSRGELAPEIVGGGNASPLVIHAGQRLRSKMLLSGPTPGQPCDFRMRVGTKDGPGDWSDVVFHIVR